MKLSGLGALNAVDPLAQYYAMTQDQLNALPASTLIGVVNMIAIQPGYNPYFSVAANQLLSRVKIANAAAYNTGLVMGINSYNAIYHAKSSPLKSIGGAVMKIVGAPLAIMAAPAKVIAKIAPTPITKKVAAIASAPQDLNAALNPLTQKIQTGSYTGGYKGYKQRVAAAVHVAYAADPLKVMPKIASEKTATNVAAAVGVAVATYFTAGAASSAISASGTSSSALVDDVMSGAAALQKAVGVVGTVKTAENILNPPSKSTALPVNLTTPVPAQENVAAKDNSVLYLAAAAIAAKVLLFS